jgi:hypothetical protein
MSEVEQAPPPGPEKLPARPPSKPSRAPLYIWTGIALFCLVMFGSALGIFLWSSDRFSSKDLKRATALKINYVLKGNVKKSLTVNDPAEVKGLLDALEITDTMMGPQSPTNAGTVEFTLPDGNVAVIRFISPTQLDREKWGWLYVTPRFHRKVNEALSAAEKRPIDIMRIDN